MNNPKLPINRHMFSQPIRCWISRTLSIWTFVAQSTHLPRWSCSRKGFKKMLWFKCLTLSYFLKRCSFWTEWVSFIFFYHQNTLRRFFCPKLFGRIKNRKKIVIAGWIKEILSEKTQIEKSRLMTEPAQKCDNSAVLSWTKLENSLIL